MNTPKPLHILIAGGGLSGLALAQGLIKNGHTCDVFERDADDSRKVGYYLHMNADGGEALRRCLPADLFELYSSVPTVSGPPSEASGCPARLSSIPVSEVSASTAVLR